MNSVNLKEKCGDREIHLRHRNVPDTIFLCEFFIDSPNQCKKTAFSVAATEIKFIIPYTTQDIKTPNLQNEYCHH